MNVISKRNYTTFQWNSDLQKIVCEKDSASGIVFRKGKMITIKYSKWVITKTRRIKKGKKNSEMKKKGIEKVLKIIDEEVKQVKSDDMWISSI